MMFRRHRSSAAPVTTTITTTSQLLPVVTPYNDDNDNENNNGNHEEPNLSSQELLIMGQNHIIVFLCIMGLLLLTCRLGWGWTPGRDPPPDNYYYHSELPQPRLVPISTQNVTIVTAYIPKSTHESNDDGYKKEISIQRFTSLQDNMIIFTVRDLIPTFKKLRKSHPNTRFVSIVDQDEASPTFQPFEGQTIGLEHDSQQTQHPFDYKIPFNTMSHSMMMKRAIQWNPFESTFWAWVDIQYLQDSLVENQRMIRFLPSTMTQQQLLLLDDGCHVPIHHSDANKNTHISDTFIGGHREGLQQWIKELHNNALSGKEHWCTLKSCHDTPGLCFLVRPRNTYGDELSFMAPYLHGVCQYFGPFDHLKYAFRSSRLYIFFKWFLHKDTLLSSR